MHLGYRSNYVQKAASQVDVGRMSNQDARCDRAQQWISLRLDGELSQLEQAMLRGHVARCGGCARFARDVADATEALRSAQLVALDRPFATPSRRRYPMIRRTALAAAAALLIVAGGLGTALRGPATDERAFAPSPGMLRASAGDDRQLRDLRRAQLQAELIMLQATFAREFGAVT